MENDQIVELFPDEPGTGPFVPNRALLQQARERRRAYIERRRKDDPTWEEDDE